MKKEKNELHFGSSLDQVKPQQSVVFY